MIHVKMALHGFFGSSRNKMDLITENRFKRRKVIDKVHKMTNRKLRDRRKNSK